MWQIWRTSNAQSVFFMKYGGILKTIILLNARCRTYATLSRVTIGLGDALCPVRYQAITSINVVGDDYNTLGQHHTGVYASHFTGHSTVCTTACTGKKTARLLTTVTNQSFEFMAISKWKPPINCGSPHNNPVMREACPCCNSIIFICGKADARALRKQVVRIQSSGYIADDSVIICIYFPRNCPYTTAIHPSRLNSPQLNPQFWG